MAKVRTRFVCSECGSVSTRWLGRCPHCGEWNTLAEETEKAAVPAAAASSVRQNDTKPAPLREIKLEDVPVGKQADEQRLDEVFLPDDHLIHSHGERCHERAVALDSLIQFPDIYCLIHRRLIDTYTVLFYSGAQK